MSQFHVLNEDYVQAVRASFDEQGLMRHLGARLDVVEPGHVGISIPYSEGLTQHHGLFHAGAITSVVDSACGYAALTLMPAGADVLSVEFKVNFLSPASGESAIARGRVLRPGRTISVCHGEVMMVREGVEKLCAVMLATMISR